MNEINSFTFYRDYFNLIDTMPIEDKRLLAVAILDFVFKDEIPSLNGHNQAIFNTLSKQLNLSKCNSKRSTKIKPEENQIKTELKPNSKPKENKTSILSFKFYISNFKFINNNTKLINKLEEWFKYKSERKENYKETGLNTFLKRIDNYVEIYGDDVIIDLIDESMSNNWKGIIFDKLKNYPKVKEPEWFDKKVEKQVCEESHKELEEILREYK